MSCNTLSGILSSSSVRQELPDGVDMGVTVLILISPLNPLLLRRSPTWWLQPGRARLRTLSIQPCPVLEAHSQPPAASVPEGGWASPTEKTQRPHQVLGHLLTPSIPYPSITPLLPHPLLQASMMQHSCLCGWQFRSATAAYFLCQRWGSQVAPLHSSLL